MYDALAAYDSGIVGMVYSPITMTELNFWFEGLQDCPKNNSRVWATVPRFPLHFFLEGVPHQACEWTIYNSQDSTPLF